MAASRYTRVSAGVYRDSVTGQTVHSKSNPGDVAPNAVGGAGAPAPAGPAPTPAYNSSIAVPGERTSGTKLGVAREINPASLTQVAPMQAAQIAPVINANAPTLPSAVTAGTPQVAGTTVADPAQVELANQFRSKQLALAQALDLQAQGQGPSVAGLQLQAGLDRGLQQQMGAIAAQRGINPALASRIYGQQANQLTLSTLNQAAQMRMAEAIAARQQQGEVLGTARTADIGVQEANQAATNANIQTQAQLDAAKASQQAQLAGSIGVTNASAQNTVAQNQADFQARVALANQLAGNTQNYNQAQLTQGAAQQNQTTATTQAQQKAELEQQAAISNQNAFNANNSTQGQIAGGVQQSSISGSAQVRAAGESAAGQVGAANAIGGSNVTVAAINAANHVSDQQQGGGVNAENTATNASTAGSQQNASIVGGVLGAAGTVGAAAATPGTVGSDERMKKNVQSGDEPATDMLDNLAAKIFEYKSKVAGSGKQLGVMAQDLEKSQMGQQMVEEGPDGNRQINFAKGLAAMLASEAALHKRLQSVEARV